MLTKKEQAFLDHYLSTGDKGAAVIAAGYPVRATKTPEGVGGEILSRKHIQTALKERRHAMATRLSITEGEIIQRMWEEAINPDNKSLEKQKALCTIKEWLFKGEEEKETGLVINLTSFESKEEEKPLLIPDEGATETTSGDNPLTIEFTDYSEKNT